MHPRVSTYRPAISIRGIHNLHRLRSLSKRIVLNCIRTRLKGSPAVKEFLLFFLTLAILSPAATPDRRYLVDLVISYPIPHVFYIHRLLYMQVPDWTFIV